MEKLLNEKEAAELLGQSPRTLQQWRWRATGPRYVKNGRSVRYSLTDLQEFIDRNAVEVSDSDFSGKR